MRKSFNTGLAGILFVQTVIGTSFYSAFPTKCTNFERYSGTYCPDGVYRCLDGSGTKYDPKSSCYVPQNQCCEGIKEKPTCGKNEHTLFSGYHDFGNVSGGCNSGIVQTGQGVCNATTNSNWSKSSASWGCCPCPPLMTAAVPDSCTLGQIYECGGCSSGTEIITHADDGSLVCTPTCVIPFVDPSGKQLDCNPKLRGSCPRPALCEPVTKDKSTCVMDGGGCKINAKGLAMTRWFEKCCPVFYQTTDRDNTTGWGHDCTLNKDCPYFEQYQSMGMPLGAADYVFNNDLQKFALSLSKWDEIDQVNTNIFSALLDFAFRNGPTGARRKFSQQVKTHDYAGICRDLDSKTDTRRQAQAALCRTKTTVLSGC